MSHLGRFCRVFLVVILVAIPVACSAQESDRESTSPPKTRYELDLQYAQTRLRLAEVELAAVMEIERAAPGTISKLAIERLKSSVAIAKEQLAQAELASVTGPGQVRLRQAEEKERLARLDLQTAQQQREKGQISELELERLRLKHELAKLSLVILKEPEHFSTLLHFVEAKVDRLGDEILSLDQRLSKLEPVRGVLPKSR
ncbi:hypothetical protein FYK55_14850 [Roseiconus nitratireducens]|uniref:DUF4142 domain-containing protein n=1 Tax=Roseiconus nitratireducens TaxID=2605748 RepID=A0A5M6DA68_9BACT|nr:hypothetical protein [Roseiconus nitratireducens]KAA5542085.1 hypothetical protein FYK55_14850 [Roseiconus nitratireducens]